MSKRRLWIEDDSQRSIRKQCVLLGIPRSTCYYKPVPESPLNLKLMRLIDVQYLQTPYYGRDKYTHWLQRIGYAVNEKRIGRLMGLMGIKSLLPSPKTTIPNRSNQIYPYLLRGLEIDHCNQVWASDITWIPTATGYLYLVAIMDWYSRYVLSWSLSDSLQSDFCISALEEALSFGTPEIFNTDQGTQFTSHDFTGVLKCRDIRISMDGKGRYADNILIERLWRTVKYEEVYLNRYETGEEAYEGLQGYLTIYNEKRLHQSLNYKTPAEVYSERVA